MTSGRATSRRVPFSTAPPGPLGQQPGSASLSASRHRKGNKCRKKSQSASKGLGWPPQEQSPGPAGQGALQQPPEGSDLEHRVLPELVCVLPAHAQLGQSTWQQLCEGYLL